MKRKDILNALEKVSSGVSTNIVGGLIEQAQHFIFWKGRVRTFNEEVLFTFPLDVGIEEAAVRFEMYSLLKNIKTKQIMITDSKEEILINSKKMTAGIKKESEIKSPAVEIKIPKEWKNLPEGFKEAVGFCLTSISDNMAMPQFTAIHFSSKLVESSDNYRITRYYLKSPFEKDVLIAGRFLKEVIKNRYTKYNFDNNWLHFKDEEGKTYSCRVMKDVSFPDTSSLIKKEGISINLPERLSSVLSRTFVFTEQEKGRAKADLYIKVSKGEWNLKSSSLYGWVKEKIKSDYEGKKEFSFRIASKFLMDAIKLGCTLVIGDTSACLISDKLTHTMVIER